MLIYSETKHQHKDAQ